jgi:3-deoxy-manno-octulosonate cytidylyltransferase (CMP-KDO synthetase)|tara:strand:+ start:91 stop:831 length:741 start_codon:yes stop_codon:yes gene_type:complete
MTKTLILIPSRMAATRLPGKPLLKINNLSIISQVFKRAKETNIGEVIVATENQEILDDVIANNGKGILTGSGHKTGTDRIYEAFEKLKMKKVDYILNLQGDEPNINKDDIIKLNDFMINSEAEIVTLASSIKDNEILSNKNVVKVITKNDLLKNSFSSAVNFTRDDLSKNYKNIYHHIGIYIYRVSALEKFVKLNQTKNEIENKLEQLRALDNKMKIDVVLAESSSIGVDTKEDYLALKKIMEYKS